MRLNIKHSKREDIPTVSPAAQSLKLDQDGDTCIDDIPHPAGLTKEEIKQGSSTGNPSSDTADHKERRSFKELSSEVSQTEESAAHKDTPMRDEDGDALLDGNLPSLEWRTQLCTPALPQKSRLMQNSITSHHRLLTSTQDKAEEKS